MAGVRQNSAEELLNSIKFIRNGMLGGLLQAAKIIDSVIIGWGMA